MVRLFWIPLFITACSQLVISAQDGAYLLKQPKPKVGEKVKYQMTESETENFTQTVQGKITSNKRDKKTELVFVEEVFEYSEKVQKPTHATRAYQSATLQEGAMAKNLDLAGKTVTIKKEGDKYTYMIDGKPLPQGPALELLVKEFENPSSIRDDQFFATKPIKVGETWKIETKPFAESLAKTGLNVDLENAKASGKLAGWNNEAGAGRGRAVMELELPLSKIKNGEQDIPLTASSAKLKLELSGSLDGSEAVMTGQLTALLELNFSAGPSTNKIEIKTLRTIKMEPVKK